MLHVACVDELAFNLEFLDLAFCLCCSHGTEAQHNVCIRAGAHVLSGGGAVVVVAGRGVVGVGGGARSSFLFLSVLFFSLFLLLVQVWEELEHGEFYIGTAWWQWEALSEWRYHNDAYGGLSGLGGAGGPLQDIFDLPVYKNRWTKDSPRDPSHWKYLCTCILISSFPFPFSLRDSSGERQRIIWKWSQIKVALTNKVRGYLRVRVRACACAFSCCWFRYRMK